MSRKPVGWQQEPERHSLAARGIGTRTSILGQSIVAGYRPSTLNIAFRHTDLKIFGNDKAYEALDSAGWSLEGAYDFLNEELGDLKAEYAVSRSDETKLQMEIIHYAKVMVREERSYIRSWPEIRARVIEKHFGED